VLRAGPLEGCTVLDFTRILSGPYATMLLADLGADVVKIERPGQGDDTRSWGPPFWNGMSTYFAAVNRGKRSVAVDLASTAGRAAVQALAAGADVLVENFRPGVMERLGLSYDSLRELNPGLIYASINGFGSAGPKAHEPGTEVIVEAETGLMAMMGAEDGPPARFGVAMVDIATGMVLVNGVLAALLDCTRSGRGRQIEFPLYSTAFSVLGTVIASASIDAASQQGRWGSGHPSIVPYSAFQADDGYVVLGAINPVMWERLCVALGLEDLRLDTRSRDNAARVRNRSFVEAAVGRAVVTRTVGDLVRALGESGVLVAPVRAAAEAIVDPQVDELGLVDIDNGVRFTRTPLSQFNGNALSRAPQLGEHTRDVLVGLGGLDEEAVGDLVAAGVVHPGDTAP